MPDAQSCFAAEYSKRRPGWRCKTCTLVVTAADRVIFPGHPAAQGNDAEREVPSMTVQSPPPPPSPPGTPQAQKKGMGPLAWIGIGCGVIVLLGCIVMGAFFYFVKSKADEFQKNPALSAAKLAVQLNPDLDLVSSDEKAQTLT